MLIEKINGRVYMDNFTSISGKNIENINGKVYTEKMPEKDVEKKEEEKRKEPKWRDAWYDFSQETTLHGLNKVTGDTQFTLRR